MLDTLDIELSGLCNARCTFCPRERMTRASQLMPFSVLERLIQEIGPIRPEGPRVIYFSGFGEPLLNRDSFLFARKVQTAFPDTQSALISNGSLLDQDICDQLLESPFRMFSCSFQAADPTMYASSMKGLKQSTVYRWLSYLVSNRKPGGIQVAATCVVNGQATEEIRQLRVCLAKIGVPLVENRIHNRGGFLDLPGNKHHNVRRRCLLFSTRTFVAANGDILACCHDLDGSTKLGNIVEQRLDDIVVKKQESVEAGRLYSICQLCSDESAG